MLIARGRLFMRKHLMFHISPSVLNEHGNYDIYMMDINGENLQQLNKPAQRYDSLNAAFSPNGHADGLCF